VTHVLAWCQGQSFSLALNSVSALMRRSLWKIDR